MSSTGASLNTKELFNGSNPSALLRSWLNARSQDDRDAMNRRADAYERQERIDKVAHRLERAGIPKAFQSADIARVPELQGVDPSRNMLMVGEAGRGKTYAACAVARHRAQECSVRFSTMGDVLLDIQGSYRGGNPAECVAKYRNATLLVIDDLGKEKPTDYAVGQFFALLNARIDAEKQTIVTTNYRSKELLARLAQCGESETALAIMSRLTCSAEGKAGFVPIQFKGGDKRRMLKRSNL